MDCGVRPVNIRRVRDDPQNRNEHLRQVAQRSVVAARFLRNEVLPRGVSAATTIHLLAPRGYSSFSDLFAAVWQRLWAACISAWGLILVTSACGPSAALHCKLVKACFFSKHFMIYETPHSASSLSHRLPWGEGTEKLPSPLPWGEGVGHGPTGEGLLWLRLRRTPLRRASMWCNAEL